MIGATIAAEATQETKATIHTRESWEIRVNGDLYGEGPAELGFFINGIPSVELVREHCAEFERVDSVSSLGAALPPQKKP